MSVEITFTTNLFFFVRICRRLSSFARSWFTVFSFFYVESHCTMAMYYSFFIRFVRRFLLEFRSKHRYTHTNMQTSANTSKRHSMIFIWFQPITYKRFISLCVSFLCGNLLLKMLCTETKNIWIISTLKSNRCENAWFKQKSSTKFSCHIRAFAVHYTSHKPKGKNNNISHTTVR